MQPDSARRQRRTRTVSEPLAVDVSGSFAQKVGQDVRVVLAVPQVPELPEPTVLRLNNGKRNVRAPLAQRDTAEGTVLESSVPAATLRPSVWSLALVGGAGA